MGQDNLDAEITAGDSHAIKAATQGIQPLDDREYLKKQPVTALPVPAIQEKSPLDYAKTGGNGWERV